MPTGWAASRTGVVLLLLLLIMLVVALVTLLPVVRVVVVPAMSSSFTATDRRGVELRRADFFLPLLCWASIFAE